MTNGNHGHGHGRSHGDGRSNGHGNVWRIWLRLPTRSFCIVVRSSDWSVCRSASIAVARMASDQDGRLEAIPLADLQPPDDTDRIGRVIGVTPQVAIPVDGTMSFMAAIGGLAVGTASSDDEELASSHIR